MVLCSFIEWNPQFNCLQYYTGVEIEVYRTALFPLRLLSGVYLVYINDILLENSGI